MKRKELFVLASVLLFSLPMVLGFGGPSPEQPKEETAAYPTLVDNFEDGDMTKDPSWWKFDSVILKVDKSHKYKGGDSAIEGATGEYILKIDGSTKKWYVGGLGAYIAKDASGYNSISLDVYGSGKGSGKLKVELYDDDNNSMQIEQNPKTYAPLNDDRFIYEIDVNWTGWKRVKIPFASLKDDNAGVGNDKWDPDTMQGSGGLLHIQIILVAAEETGAVNLAVDNIELTN